MLHTFWTSRRNRVLPATAISAVLAVGFLLGPLLPASADTAQPTSPATPSPTSPAPKPGAPVPGPATSPSATPPVVPGPPPSSAPPVKPGTRDPEDAGKDPSARAAMRSLIGPGAKMGQANPQSKNKGGNNARGMGVPSLLPGAWQPAWGISGVDVSAYQTSLDWGSMYGQGVRFAYVKASEGNYYTNSLFSSQYFGSQSAGMIRGAYHFAIPNWSSGADQARYFVSNGGGWTPDGITLPPVLDIEYNPYAGQTINGVYMGNTCYSMSPAQMVGWINDFSNTVLSLTGRRPMVYSTSDWWGSCTGNSAAFSNNPLWIAAYNTSGPGTLPASWGNFSVWQYSSSGPFPGDSNVWNGDYSGLKRFATYGDADPSASMGAAASAYTGLGGQTSGIACGLKNGGCYQFFQNGALNWSSATGARPTYYGAVRTAWANSGYENGALGYPTTDQICGQLNGGCYQMFQGGAISYSPGTGAQLSLYGPIRDAWGANGFERGILGYPTTGKVCGQVNGGCYQMFQGGGINWTSATGAQLSIYGPIRDAWGASGFENGALGYPTTGKVCGQVNGGCYQMFQGGGINYSPATGAQLSLYGPIRNAWGANGFENGKLGYPTTGKICGQVNGGCYQMFQGGGINYSPATGAQLSTWGAIRNAWAATGFQDGRMGYPTSSGETCGLVRGGCYQMFQGGGIVWSPATGAQLSTWGAIRNAWANLGFENSRLGYPTTSEICSSSSSCYQNYQGGTISWTATGGAVVSYS
jgi:uncharacterized protein with LGFP repeats